MRVYRVEDFSGTGVYSLSVGFPGDTYLHPLPDEDKGLREEWNEMPYKLQQQYFFGFSSIEQMERWFREEEKKCFIYYNENRCESDDKRVGVSVYECLPEDVIIGDRQAVFIKNRAQWVEFRPFVTAKELIA